jgi:hypothetical protein
MTPLERVRSTLSVLFAAALTASCTITQHVEPLPADAISAVCIKENPEVWSKGFLPELQAQFERHGIQTTVYTDQAPAGCRHRVEYTANWYWDVAVYLKYVDIRVYDGDQLVGSATYDARHAGARPDKFGRTAVKLERIMDELLRNVQHRGAVFLGRRLADRPCTGQPERLTSR